MSELNHLDTPKETIEKINRRHFHLLSVVALILVSDFIIVLITLPNISFEMSYLTAYLILKSISDLMILIALLVYG